MQFLFYLKTQILLPTFYSLERRFDKLKRLVWCVPSFPIQHPDILIVDTQNESVTTSDKPISCLFIVDHEEKLV